MAPDERLQPRPALSERPWFDTTKSASLETLLTRVGRGDQAAFTDLYDQTAPSVYGMLNRLLGDSALIEDLATRNYVQSWRTAARYDPASRTPPGWLLILIHRQLTDATGAIRRAVS